MSAIQVERDFTHLSDSLGKRRRGLSTATAQLSAKRNKNTTTAAASGASAAALGGMSAISDTAIGIGAGSVVAATAAAKSTATGGMSAAGGNAAGTCAGFAAAERPEDEGDNRHLRRQVLQWGRRGNIKQ